MSSNFSLVRRNESQTFLCEALNPTLCAQAGEEGIEIPVLIESKRLWGINWQQSFNYAINLSNQVQVNVPLVLQSKEYEFSTQTGDVYSPPEGYEALFHPDKTILGFGDVQAGVQHYVFLPNLVVGVEGGVRLPTASTKFNEYSLLEYHQPLGTGTLVPTTRLILFSRGEKHGVLSSAGTQTPLYANVDGYRTGNSMNVDMGYWRRVTDQKMLLLGQLSLLHETRDFWYTQAIPYSHRTFLRGSMMGTYPISDSLEGMLRMEMQLYRMVWDDDVTNLSVSRTPVFSVGLTWL